MADWPNTLLEFEERFATEEACRQYLYDIRWPSGFRCPKCGSAGAWSTGRKTYRCHRCDHQISVTAGTIFHDTRFPLRAWFRAIWSVTSQKHGISAVGMQRALGLGSYRTAWVWLHKLRRAMVRPGRERLTGIVEIDETYVGGERPGKRGRGAAGKTLVIVATEVHDDRIGRIRMQRVNDASEASLTAAVRANVEPGSEVRTDGWSGYVGLVPPEYQHTIIRRDATIGDNLLPHVNRVVSLVKRWLLGSHQGAVRPTHLDYYLDEFTFRFNRRTSRSRGMLFYRLIQQAVAVDPVTADALRSESLPKPTPKPALGESSA